MCTPLLLQSPSLHIQSSLSRQCTGVVKASATSQQPVPEEPWYLGKRWICASAQYTGNRALLRYLCKRYWPMSQVLLCVSYGLHYRSLASRGCPSSALRALHCAGFQCNERYLQWDQAAQLQLLRLVLAEKLAIEDDEVVSRLRELAILLPDFLTRMNNTRVDILLPILSDLPVSRSAHRYALWPLRLLQMATGFERVV